ncbi:hypothetical protein A5707_04850 [Mycobacterium kyorinense]|uniref:STAS domain-containing protein n=1 Tax=Mycobacterium kyorinense TaxID=487514 RepID=A0A1A2YZL1_9MYCO|nr:MEDS domain-containing protein [Mycobacterium kyorinense]OBI43719.1 hypothetical protein A5707_04850 [Mycobacterium kyorinense]
MRRHGVLSSAAGLGPFAHLGWGYCGQEEFRVRAGEYISDGLAADQCIEYVADRDGQSLRAELAEIGFDDAVKSGRIHVTPAEDFFAFTSDGLVDPRATIAKRLGATEHAVSTGYSGLRAAVDDTPVARTPEQREALACYEQLLDREMLTAPFSALCAYDTTVLRDAAGELICLHPFVGGGAVGFRLFAEQDAGFALAGEIDVTDSDTFVTAIGRVLAVQGRDALVVDASGLDFTTHHQLLALDRHARAVDRQVVLRTGQPVIARLAQLLELTNVRVEE